MSRLNPKVRYHPYPHHLRPTEAVEIFEQYDIVLDCTDHPTSRYLISDACVLAGKPLVSASALKTEGQLMTLNMPPGAAPCYRCVFPKPPPADSVISCGEGGILGPVVGIMGVLQAAKAIEMITMHASLAESGQPPLVWKDMPAKLWIYSALDSQPFRPPITLKQRRKGCTSCSASPSVTRESLRSGSLDYAAFCGWNHPVRVLDGHERISAENYKTKDDHSHHTHILVDVREKLHFDICHIPGSINVPYSLIASRTQAPSSQDTDARSTLSDPDNELSPLQNLTSIASASPNIPIYFICRFGNDSQEAVRFLKKNYPALVKAGSGERFVGDIEGGLHAWSKVEPSFPNY